MYKKHTLYTFQSNEPCPHCNSTKILSFEIEENLKQINVVRCEDCGIEDVAVYDLGNEYIYSEPWNEHDEPGYTRVKKIEWSGKLESIRQQED